MRYGALLLVLSHVVMAQVLPVIDVSPAQIRFDDTNYTFSQTIAVTTDTEDATVEVSVDGGATGLLPPAWLEIGSRLFSTPSRLRVSVNAARRPTPGSYRARILLRPLRSNAAPVVIPVTLELKLAEQPFTVSPGSIRFIGQVGGFLPAQYIVLPSGIGCDQVRARSEDRFLTVLAEPVQNCNRFLVGTRALNAAPGSYRGKVTLDYRGQEKVVLVTAFLAPAGPLLDTDPDGVQFEVRQGNGNSVTRNITILNRGTGSFTWKARDVFGPTPWLSFGALSGMASSESDGRLPITVAPGQIAAGTYHAAIEIAAEGARNSPNLFTLVMRVLPADAPAVVTPSPSGMIFNVLEGSGQSAPQTETVFVSSNQALPYRITTQLEGEGLSWLLTSATSGVTSTGSPTRFNIAVQPGSLKPGVYRGEVNVYLLAKGSTEIRAVNITMIIRPKPVVATPPPQRGIRLAEGCTASRLAPTHTGLVNSFATSVGWPTPINVRIVDDCGEQANGAQAVLSFSNGDAPLVLTNQLNGNYSGTWVPKSATTPVTIRADVAQGPLSASIELAGKVSPTATPVVFPNGIVRVFDRQEDGTLAPGTAIEIYGSNLAGGSVVASVENNKLPETVGDVSVVLGGARLPLYGVTPGQLNAQVRMESPTEQSLPLVVKSGNAISVPVRVPILAQQPGLLSFPDTRIIAHDENFALLSAANPAKRGRPIILYLVGMGKTAPEVESGALSPGQPLASSAAPPEVVFGSKRAQVLFAGLTPGFVGLYQINITVPTDLTPGDTALVVRQGPIDSNETIVPVQ